MKSKNCARQPLAKLALCLFLGAISVFSAAEEGDEATQNTINSVTDIFTQGEVNLKLRLRYEDVDQDSPIDKNAGAITLKSTLNFKTAAYQGLSAFVEVDNVTALGGENYNSTINGKTSKSVIADPDGTEVNQAWLNYQWNKTSIKYGRQRINFDNQRFVGGVAFRQNEQTYDAFSISDTSLANTDLFYARVYNVNRIFGEDSTAGDHDSSTDLFNVKYAGLPFAAISAYAYLIENDDVKRFSTDTFGIRLSGSRDVNKLKMGYTLEVARQEDANGNPVSYDADYLLLEGSVKFPEVKITLGYELLSSDDGRAAFITPLATLHKFQGWTDQFLVTPNQGIADIYLSAAGSIRGVKLMAVYHDFSADENNTAGADDLGDEFGFIIDKKWEHYGLSFKYANYQAGDSSFSKSDTQKFWVTATSTF